MILPKNFKPFDGNPDYFLIRVYDTSHEPWDTIEETMTKKMEKASIKFYDFLAKYKNNTNVQVSIHPCDKNGNAMVELTNDITKAERNRAISVINTDLLTKTKVSSYEVIKELVNEMEAETLIIPRNDTNFEFYADPQNNRVFIANKYVLNASNMIYIFPTPSQFLSNYKYWCNALNDNLATMTLRHWINENKGDEHIGEVSPSRWEYNLEMMQNVLLKYCDHYIEKVYGEIRYTHPKMPNEVIFTTKF